MMSSLSSVTWLDSLDIVTNKTRFGVEENERESNLGCCWLCVSRNTVSILFILSHHIWSNLFHRLPLLLFVDSLTRETFHSIFYIIRCSIQSLHLIHHEPKVSVKRAKMLYIDVSSSYSNGIFTSSSIQQFPTQQNSSTSRSVSLFLFCLSPFHFYSFVRLDPIIQLHLHHCHHCHCNIYHSLQTLICFGIKKE